MTAQLCPVCGLDGGFHDMLAHLDRIVPRDKIITKDAAVDEAKKI